ncbi:hypothetical protein F2Q69_00048967 [Brassica cretica]|uniref:Uncharacterized protein n=1 Tax=Brassica cretica TaxID=69181 RepID=A0A8S9PJI8_BRACR|nr:hypothetical protein F2Q69_00048967 [Brassica cretica]
MFPELSAKDQQMALLYISSPNDVERSARIRRVEMEIEDNKLKEANAIPTLTHDLNKDLGLVFGYKQGNDHIRIISLGVGSSIIFVSGTSGQLKKPCNRPPSWKRRGRVTQKLHPSKATGTSADNECRLDRAFGNDKWFNLFLKCQAEYMSTYASDHMPIITCFSFEESQTNKGRFYFEKHMLEKEGVEDTIMQGWLQGGENASLLDRISTCRKYLARWKRTSDLNSKSKMERLHSELEHEICQASPNFQTMKRLKLELAEAYLSKERFWRQKSHQQWLKSGDKNTRFFHNSVKGRKNLNRILMLLDDLGVEHFSQKVPKEILQ